MTFGRQGGARLRRLGTALGISLCCLGGALTASARAPEHSPAPMPRPAAEAPATAAATQPAPRPTASAGPSPTSAAPRGADPIPADAPAALALRAAPARPASQEVATARPAPRPAEAAVPLGIAAAAVPGPTARTIDEAAAALDNDAVAAALDWPAPRAAEPAPRVRAAQSDTPRPEARPEPLEAEVSSRGSIAPLALALSPPARPEGLAPRPAAAPAASLAARGATAAAISSLAVAQSRLPRPRPEAERRAFVQRAAAVRTQPGPGAVTGRATGQLCGVAGIEGQPIPPVVSNVQGCGVPNAVRVSAVDGVRLSQSAIMDCETAQALHRWVRAGLKPAVGGLGGGVAELRVAGHYVCRTRNHRAGARISEHGRGRAIDISAIRLVDGRVLDVLSQWRHRSYGPILRQAHAAACGPFNTTLGPGSDGMHEDHFHYDLRRGGRYCR